MNGLGQPLEDAGAVVVHERGLAVQQLGRAADGGAADDAERLVAEAHPNIGLRQRAHSSMIAIETPASSGVPGPGETRTPS